VDGKLMRKFLALFALLFLAHSARASISYVNTTSGQDNGSSQNSIAATAVSHTTGNLVVASVGFYGSAGTSASVTSVTDTAGNTYHQATGAFAVQAAILNSDIWFAYNITGNASNVVTVHFGTTFSYIGLVVTQYSGELTSSTPFEVAGFYQNYGTTMTTSSFSPAASGNLNVAIGMTSGPTFTAGSGYTIRQALTGPGAAMEDLVGASSGSQTAVFTLSGAQNGAMSVASFKGAASTPTVHGPPGIMR
jgi:hypothetical protein